MACSNERGLMVYEVDSAAHALGEQDGVQHVLDGLAGDEVCEGHCGCRAAGWLDPEGVLQDLHSTSSPGCIASASPSCNCGGNCANTSDTGILQSRRHLEG